MDFFLCLCVPRLGKGSGWPNEVDDSEPKGTLASCHRRLGSLFVHSPPLLWGPKLSPLVRRNGGTGDGSNRLFSVAVAGFAMITGWHVFVVADQSLIHGLGLRRVGAASLGCRCVG
ncbi:hypothetical protein Tsubulata_014613 [Turnera subulata]|uniref:Uncharacterized protein n=1 Tax=Turnera subulata TaxID=218843 RepID=A0A9Q0GHF5_9ROSI|nr:hypothetical protein Tsubulata_014613 [Turnera subulata]